MMGFNYYGYGAVILSRWMKEYFNSDNPHCYIFEDKGIFGLTAISEDNSNGFVFTNENARFESLDSQFNFLKEAYIKSSKVKVSRSFIDYDNKIAGFSWNQKGRSKKW